MQHHVIHHIHGRLRLRLPELSPDQSDNIARLHTLLAAIPQVKTVRVNPIVQSVVVEYRTDPIATTTASPDLAATIAAQLDRFCVTGVSVEPSLEPISQRPTTDTNPAPAIPLNDDWEQLAVPIASLGLAGLATVIELPIVFLAGMVGIAAWPIVERGLAGLTAPNPADRRLKVELLDSLWMVWQLTQGQAIAPALLATLTETGILVRDRTRQEERDELSILLDHQTQGQAWIERDGLGGIEAVAIDVPSLCVGDVVIVGADERVPIDGEIVAITPATEIAAPSWCEPGQIPTVAIGRRIDAGTLVMRGELRVRALRSGQATHAAIVRHLADTATTTQTQLGDRLDRISESLVAPTLLGSGALLAAGIPLQALPLLQLDFGTGLHVVLPTTALSALIGAARQGIYLRNALVLERLVAVKLAMFELSSVVTPLAVTEVYPLNAIAPTELAVLAASVYHELGFALGDVLDHYVRTQAAEIVSCDRHHVVLGGGIEAEIRGAEIWIGSEAWLVERGIHAAAFRQRYPDLFQHPVTSSRDQRHEFEREFERLLFVVRDRELLGAVGYRVQLCPTATEAIATLHAAGITPYLIGDDRAQVIEAIAQALQIAPAQTIAAATPTRRLQVLETLSEHHTRDAELLWVSRDREFEIPKDQAGLFAEIGTTFDVSLADPRIDLVAIDGDLRDLPHAITLARQASTMTALNAVTVMLPNLSVVLTGMLLGFDPVLAVLVNQCAVLLAEFNGLQLRRGRSKSHRWPLTDHGGIDPDATLSDRDLEALFTERRIDPSPSSPPTQSQRPSPGSTDFPQNPQNLAIS